MAKKLHCLTAIEEHGYTRIQCTVCGRSWKNGPQESCVGVRIFQWEPWPEHLMTKAQLNAAGYQTGKLLPAPSGVIFREKSPDGKMWLYNPLDATPKREMSEAQRCAIEKAQAAARELWSCVRCHGRLRYAQKNGLCEYCEMQTAWEGDRYEAQEWARRMLADPDAVILDTETTSLNTSRAEIVEIAIIDMAGEALLNTLVLPVYPERMFGGASDIHGIMPWMLADAPMWTDVFEKVQAVIRGRHVIIYNRDYDQNLLNNLSRRHELPLLEALEWHCAMEEYSAFCGDFFHHYERGRYAGWDYRWQPLGGNHRALGDCRATLATLREIAKEEREPVFHAD